MRTVLRSRPKRWAAGAAPWTFTYASMAQRSRTFPRYGDFLDCTAIVDPLSWHRLSVPTWRVPFLSKYFIHGLEVNRARRLRQLEQENTRLLALKELVGQKA